MDTPTKETPYSVHANRLQELYGADARLGTIIHIAGACADVEEPSEPMAAFFEDAADQQYVIDTFEPIWPGYGARVLALAKDYERERADDRMTARLMLNESMSDFFLRYCPRQLLVSVDFQLRCYSHPNPNKERAGGYSSGWGYYSTRWVLADTCEQAIDQCIELAFGAATKAWREALQAPKPRPRKKTK